MSVRNATYNSFSATNYDSVTSVIEDLISERSIWRKVVCLLLCVTFLLNAWAVIVLHLVPYTNETVLEVSVSVITLVVGQYLGTGIVNGYVYWSRWNKTPVKSRAKAQEQNKEAWVCMRITMTLLGLAPVARYVESIVVIRRMLMLEKEYMSDAAKLVKEGNQPSSLPTGSLISAPSTAARPSVIARSWEQSTQMSASRIRALDAGIHKVYKVRRQFRRTEHDAGIVALASGVLGAGPFVITQGVLYFRRVGINFQMPVATWVGIMACSVTGIVWICAALTHYYPAPYDQSEFDFDRGLGQVPFGGLIILFFARLIHVSVRCGTFVLFTAQFYWIVLGVVLFQYVFVLICLVVSRACTRADYSNPAKMERSSIATNILSDLMFSYVSIFEFTNAYAKYTRTRYLLYYFVYYLENSSMIGVWYVYFTFPEMWYYLPSLLTVTLAQFLGFILLQVYLFLYSKARRKRTLCGLCFAHLNEQSGAKVHFDPAAEGHDVQRHSVIGEQQSVLSNRTNTTQPTVKKSSSGLYDPIFGQKIAQAAVPKSRRKDRVRRESRTSRPTIHEDTRRTASNELLSEYTRRPLERTIAEGRQYRPTAGLSEYPSYSDLAIEDDIDGGDRLWKDTSLPMMPISAEEAIEREVSLQRRSRKTHTPLPEDELPSVQLDENLTNTEKHRGSEEMKSQKQQRGVFRPRPDQNWSRQRWPYARNPSRK